MENVLSAMIMDYGEVVISAAADPEVTEPQRPWPSHDKIEAPTRFRRRKRPALNTGT